MSPRRRPDRTAGRRQPRRRSGDGEAPAQDDDDRPPGIRSSHWRRDGSPKNRYTTRAEALAAAWDRHDESGLELSAYQCDFCHGWHVGRAGGGDVVLPPIPPAPDRRR